MNSSTISQWLGHACTSITNRYATVDLEMKRAVIDNVKPIPDSGKAPWRKGQTILEPRRLSSPRRLISPALHEAQPRHDLLQRFGKLDAQQRQDRQHAVDGDAQEEVAIPVQLAGDAAREETQHLVPIHLDENEDRRRDDGENQQPAEEQQQVVRLKRIGRHGQQQEQHARVDEDDQILQVRQHIVQKGEDAPGQKGLGEFRPLVGGRGRGGLGEAPGGFEFPGDLLGERGEARLHFAADARDGRPVVAGLGFEQGVQVLFNFLHRGDHRGVVLGAGRPAEADRVLRGERERGVVRGGRHDVDSRQTVEAGALLADEIGEQRVAREPAQQAAHLDPRADESQEGHGQGERDEREGEAEEQVEAGAFERGDEPIAHHIEDRDHHDHAEQRPRRQIERGAGERAGGAIFHLTKAGEGVWGRIARARVGQRFEAEERMGHGQLVVAQTQFPGFRPMNAFEQIPAAQ
ncbi:MAG: hypothetical protein SF339_21045 [Blastocatellia bacterium]|nr:hypothetical protein [Blastocatellia bacterium]